MNKRTIVIGDIHGGLRALDQLLSRVGLRPDDRLIFLGDYVDGWSESAPLIDFLIKLSTEHECIFIRGNHDAWCEAWLGSDAPPRAWLANGGDTTLFSYEGVTDARRAAHLGFFHRLRNYYIDEANRLFIHAGFTSMQGPSQEGDEHDCYWDRTLWEAAVRADRGTGIDSGLYPKRLLLFPEIFIGHTPTIYYDVTVPMHRCNVWNADTGAAFYGRLSALDADTNQYWQSDVVQQLYPAEKGRNK